MDKYRSLKEDLRNREVSDLKRTAGRIIAGAIRRLQDTIEQMSDLRKVRVKAQAVINGIEAAEPFSSICDTKFEEYSNRYEDVVCGFYSNISNAYEAIESGIDFFYASDICTYDDGVKLLAKTFIDAYEESEYAPSRFDDHDKPRYDPIDKAREEASQAINDIADNLAWTEAYNSLNDIQQREYDIARKKSLSAWLGMLECQKTVSSTWDCLAEKHSDYNFLKKEDFLHVLCQEMFQKVVSQEMKLQQPSLPPPPENETLIQKRNHLFWEAHQFTDEPVPDIAKRRGGRKVWTENVVEQAITQPFSIVD